MTNLGFFGINIKTPDIQESINWFKKFAGYDSYILEFFPDASVSGNKTVILLNRYGGMPILLSQQQTTIQYNNLDLSKRGLIGFFVKVNNIKSLYLRLKAEKIPIFSNIFDFDGQGNYTFWMKDSHGNNFIFLEDKNIEVKSVDPIILGIFGVLLNVPDLQEAENFFNTLGMSQTENNFNSKIYSPICLELNNEINNELLTAENFYNTPFDQYLKNYFINLVESPQSSISLSPFSLNFLVKDVYAIDKNNYKLQLRTFDNDDISIIYNSSNYASANLNFKQIELYKIRFKNAVTLNLKYPVFLKKYQTQKLKFLINNGLEKI